MNAFNPWDSVLRGQVAEQNMAQAQLEGMSLRERLALKKAAAALGNQNYFAGYEGVPGAERPAYLREAWANADPAQAMQIEGLLAKPFELNRAAEQAGKIEAAKKASDLEYNKNMMRAFWDTPESQGIAGAGNQLFASPEAGPSQATPPPSSPSTGQPTASATPALSATERTFEITPQGPKLGMKRMSPFEQSMKQGEDAARQGTLEVTRAKEKREALQQAHDNVRAITTQIRTVQSEMQNRNIPWEDGRQQLAQLQQDLARHTQARDGLLRGATPTQPMPESSATAPAQAPAAPLAPSRPETSSAPRFTEKEQATMDVKGREEKITATNKEIVGAREHALKIQQYMPQVKELFDIVTKQDIGHPGAEGLPYAENLLNLSRANAQVHKLNAALTNMFAQPGQSQLMNTIVERTMQAAAVPHLFAEPQLNKMNAANLRSNVEHLRNLPLFLEQWQKSHQGTLDGAADAWIDYIEHNPRYTYQKDKAGRVTVTANQHVKPVTDWVTGTRKIGDRTFMRQSDGSWKEQ